MWIVPVSYTHLDVYKRQEPMQATTYGVGEMISDAIDRGCRNIIMGIGGSATTDGGIGMMKALGIQFLDENGNDVGEGAQALFRVRKIQTEGVHPFLSKVRFQIACDVTNPLCGSQGAVYVFGPQKGVTEEIKAMLDEAMNRYAAVVESTLGIRCRDIPGAGAAGGLGFACLAFLNAVLTPGIDLVLNAVAVSYTHLV